MITNSTLALFVTFFNSVYVNITTTHVSCNENDNDTDNYSIEDVNID